MDKLRRSPLFYVGDKYKLMKEISKYFPKNIERFIEPFTGGGTVFLNIDAKKYLLNDIDHNIVNIHKYLISQSKNHNEFFNNLIKIIKKFNLSRSFIEDVVPQDLKKEWKKTYYAKFNKIGYKELKDTYNNSKNKDYLLLYLLLIYGFNRMLRFNSNNEFNIPVGNVDFNKNVEKALIEYFDFVKNKEIAIFKKDFSEFLNELTYKKGDFIYLDPPYLISFSEYNKLWNESNEKKLLGLLDELNNKGVKFAISNIILHKGKENKIFMDWMKKYKVYKIKSNYISYHDNGIKKIEEVLVVNYD